MYYTRETHFKSGQEYHKNIMGLLTALNEGTATKHPPLVSKQEHVNVFCPGQGRGASWMSPLPASQLL